MKYKTFKILFLFISYFTQNYTMNEQSKTTDKADEIEALLEKCKITTERFNNRHKTGNIEVLIQSQIDEKFNKNAKPTIKTPVELLIEACHNQFNQLIEKYENAPIQHISYGNSQNKSAVDYASELKERTHLDHIRITYLQPWIFGFCCREKKYLQLEDSQDISLMTGEPKKNFKKDIKKIEKINSLLSSVISVFKSKKRRTGASEFDLFTAHIDLIPLQNFFYDLLPWPNRHPMQFASGLTALGILTTWAIMRKQ